MGSQDAGVDYAPGHFGGRLPVFFKSRLAAATARLISFMGIVSSPLSLASWRIALTTWASSWNACLPPYRQPTMAERLMVNCGVIKNWPPATTETFINVPSETSTSSRRERGMTIWPFRWGFTRTLDTTFRFSENHPGLTFCLTASAGSIVARASKRKNSDRPAGLVRGFRAWGRPGGGARCALR